MSEQDNNLSPIDGPDTDKEALVDALVEKNQQVLKIKSGVKAGSTGGAIWIPLGRKE
jgi:hypothetical protein